MTDLINNPEKFFLAHRIIAKLSNKIGFWLLKLRPWILD